MRKTRIKRSRGIALWLLVVLLTGLLAGCGSETTPRKQVSFSEEGAMAQKGEETFSYTAQDYTFDGVTVLRRIEETETGFLVLADSDSGCVTLNLFREIKERSRTEWDGYLYDFTWTPGGTIFSLRDDGFYETINNKDIFLWEAKGDTLYHGSDGVSYYYWMGQRTLYKDIMEVELPEVLPRQIQTIQGMWAQGGKDYLLLSVSTEDSLEEPKSTIYTIQDDKLEKVTDVEFYGQHFAATDEYLFYVSGGHLMKSDGTQTWDCGAFSDYLVMENSINDILPLEDGRILILWDGILTVLTENEGNEASGNTEESNEQQKIVILAYDSYIDHKLEEAINDFQRENRNYVVGIHYCSDAEEMGKALVSGKFDMFMTSKGMEPIRNLVKQNCLTDIRDYMGESKDRIYPNIYEAGTVDGMVTGVPFTFTLDGMAIVEAAMEGRHYFENTIDMEKTLLSLTHQNFWMRADQRTTLQEFGGNGFESWVDRDSGTCDFEDETFLALLRMLKRFAPDMDTVEANNDGNNPLFKPRYTIHSVRSDGLLYFAEAYKSGRPYSKYGMNGKMIPIPGKGGEDGVSINSQSLISVMKDTANPQGVKDLLQYLFSDVVQRSVIEDLQTGTFSPVSELQNQFISDYAENPPDGMGKEALDRLPEDMAEVKRLVEGANQYVVDESPIKNIVNEEANRYLAGSITAETAAEYIQNRVSIYLAEQG